MFISFFNDNHVSIQNSRRCTDKKQCLWMAMVSLMRFLKLKPRYGQSSAFLMNIFLAHKGTKLFYSYSLIFAHPGDVFS